MNSKKHQYLFDKFMSKGTRSIVILLLLLTFSIIAFFSAVVFLFTKYIIPAAENPHIIWQVVTHLMDPGTIGADDINDLPNIIIMLIITVSGLLLNSVLIGSISNAIDSKLDSLKKGNSKIIEKNHTVIIGFNEAAFTILNELIEANANQKKSCVVLLSNTDIEKMNEQLEYNIGKTKTDIICRTGDPYEENVLDICSLLTAKSVIINYVNDFDTIKQILVLTKYLEKHNALNLKLNITAYITQKENVRTAVIAGKNRVKVLFFENSISRIIAHSCRYPGISRIFVDFFDFDGDEIYYEAFPELHGMSFSDVIMSFEKSAVIGLVKNGMPVVNPPKDTVYDFSAGDKIIHIAEDDNTSFPSPHLPSVDVNAIELPAAVSSEKEKKTLLVLGYNSMLNSVLQEFNNYVEKDSEVIVATENLPDDLQQFNQHSNLSVSFNEINISRYENVEQLFTRNIDTVLVLCDLNNEVETADSKVMMILLFVRDIIEKNHLKVNVISEMRSVANQKIATDKNISDFVVGSNITSLVLAQISENPDLLPVFEELLDEEGSELYMKPVTDYIKNDRSVNLHELQRIAEKRNEIVIGYKQFTESSYNIILNPPRSRKIMFGQKDLLIVVSED